MLSNWMFNEGIDYILKNLPANKKVNKEFEQITRKLEKFGSILEYRIEETDYRLNSLFDLKKEIYDTTLQNFTNYNTPRKKTDKKMIK